MLHYGLRYLLTVRNCHFATQNVVEGWMDNDNIKVDATQMFTFPPRHCLTWTWPLCFPSALSSSALLLIFWMDRFGWNWDEYKRIVWSVCEFWVRLWLSKYAANSIVGRLFRLCLCSNETTAILPFVLPYCKCNGHFPCQCIYYCQMNCTCSFQCFNDVADRFIHWWDHGLSYNLLKMGNYGEQRFTKSLDGFNLNIKLAFPRKVSSVIKWHPLFWRLRRTSSGYQASSIFLPGKAP